MKKEEKGEREDIASAAGKPRWYYSPQVSWPPLDGKIVGIRGCKKHSPAMGNLQKT